MIKSRIMRWVRHVACIREICVKNFWLQYLKERDCSRDSGADGRIILEWILRKQNGGDMWLRIDLVVGSCEHSNAPPGSIEDRM
jgi:hypothetical protein